MLSHQSPVWVLGETSCCAVPAWCEGRGLPRPGLLTEPVCSQTPEALPGVPCSRSTGVRRMGRRAPWASAQLSRGELNAPELAELSPLLQSCFSKTEGCSQNGNHRESLRGGRGESHSRALESRVEVPLGIGVERPRDPAVPLLGVYPAVRFTRAKLRDQPGARQ